MPIRPYFLISYLLLILCCVLWVDVPVALFVNGIEPGWMFTVGSWLEEVGKSHWSLAYCLVFAVAAWRLRRDWADRHLVLFAAIAASGIIGLILKVLVCRSRPPLLIEDGIFAAAPFSMNLNFLWQSFPSGHSTTGLSIAVAGSYTWPRLRWVMWTLGIGIACARIAVNIHYVSDVLAGSLIGWLCAQWCVEWHQRRLRRASSSR